jgi:hypothetical protein
MHNIGLLSNRVKKTPALNAESYRYTYLDLENAEPDWGVPDTAKADNKGININRGLAASDTQGTRNWVVIGPGLRINGDDVLLVDEEAFVSLTGDQEFSGTKTFLDQIVIGSTDSTDLGERLRVDGTISVNNITTQNPAFNLVDTVAEIINFGGQGTDINIGSSFGTTTINNDLIIKGNVTIEGTEQNMDGGYY